MPPQRLWTIGHSTHSLDEFVALLREHGVKTLVDVRRVPGSARHPQFGRDVLPVALPEQGIEYVRIEGLGGWRKPAPDSPNGAWRNKSFRAYADYALTDEFAAALDELCGLASHRNVAIMCAEALWWRCHRRLIADRLVALGWEVLDIGSDGRAAPHALPAFAVVGDDGGVRYPALPA